MLNSFNRFKVFMKKIIAIKFGGSIMVPKFPNIDYLTNFSKLVLEMKSDYRFLLITGGGGINKEYNKVAKEVATLTNEDLDWIGIYATRLNARLLVSIFGKKNCFPKVVENPYADLDWKEDIMVGAGWKPGWSTDYDAMILAHRFESEKIIIATNTSHIYNKDPHEFKDAEKLKEVSWENLRKMVGEEWTPRMHIPLDPSAIRFGQKKKIKALSLDGRDLNNLACAIRGEEFSGTIIG
jgi:uridylate kinase